MNPIRLALVLAALAAAPARAGDLPTPVTVAPQSGVVVVVPGDPSSSAGAAPAIDAGGGFLGRKAGTFAPKARSFQAGVKVNEMSTGGEVKEAVGFQPEREPGELLSLETKDNTRVVRVQPESGPFKTAVVKTATSDIVRREVLTRRILNAFPEFKSQFESPEAAAYTAGLFKQRGVMVMPDRDAPHAQELTKDQRAALGVLTYGLGISDLNHDGIRQGEDGKVLLFDFEGALTALRPGMSPAALSDPMPHVNRGHLNLPSDYQPAIDAWRKWLAAPAVRGELQEHFKLSGFSPRETRRAMQTLDGNAALMESMIVDAAALANKSFYAETRGAGLSDEQARVLSEFNRRALETPAGQAELQKARNFLRGHGPNAQRWRLWPERGNVLTASEWADLPAGQKPRP